MFHSDIMSCLMRKVGSIPVNCSHFLVSPHSYEKPLYARIRTCCIVATEGCSPTFQSLLSSCFHSLHPRFLFVQDLKSIDASGRLGKCKHTIKNQDQTCSICLFITNETIVYAFSKPIQPPPVIVTLFESEVLITIAGDTFGQSLCPMHGVLATVSTLPIRLL
jgi:hypothetical protein